MLFRMITFQDDQLKQFESDLKTFKRRAYPFATKSTVNGMAFDAQKRGRANTRNDMTLRNRFTEQSIRVEQTRTLNVARQEALTGSIADYMETQEFGGVKRSGGKQGVPIATGYAAGQEGQQPRTRLPRRANTLQNIQLRKRAGVKGRTARNVAAVREAASASNKYVYLDLGRRKGIFRVLGGKRRPRVKMVWSLTKRSVNIPATPWLAPAAAGAQAAAPAIYKRSLQQQLERHKLFVSR